MFAASAAYRRECAKLAGVAPAPGDEATEAKPRPAPAEPPPPPLGNGLAGDHLKWRMKGLGIPACQACVQDAAEMNRRGVAWCRQNVGELVKRIKPRAKRLRWGTLFGAAAKVAARNLTGGRTPVTIRGMVLAAIDDADPARHPQLGAVE